MNEWISAVLGAGLLAAVLALSAAAAPPSPDTLTIVAKHTATVFVTNSGQVTSHYPGGILVTGDRIFSADKDYIAGKEAGFDNEECTVAFNGNDLCHDYAVLPGRGTVELSYVFVSRNHSLAGPPDFSGIIDGGSGEFQNAHGTFQATGYGAVVTVPLG